MKPPIYGIAAEFRELDALIAGVKTVRDAGYKRFQAYTPFPSEELNEAIGYHGSRLPFLIFLGGLFGGLAGYLLQYWTSVHAYPLNVGGRPLHSWPAFIPVTFECTILGAALTAIFGMLALNGLPAPYHPLFHLPRFSRVSRDLFFLCVQARDPLFDAEKVTALLKCTNPSEVLEVPN